MNVHEYPAHTTKHYCLRLRGTNKCYDGGIFPNMFTENFHKFWKTATEEAARDQIKLLGNLLDLEVCIVSTRLEAILEPLPRPKPKPKVVVTDVRQAVVDLEGLSEEEIEDLYTRIEEAGAFDAEVFEGRLEFHFQNLNSTLQAIKSAVEGED